MKTAQELNCTAAGELTFVHLTAHEFDVQVTEAASRVKLNCRVFQREGSEIVVLDMVRQPMFRARPYLLASEGECMLEIIHTAGAVIGEPLRLWQVSRFALEDLLFP